MFLLPDMAHVYLDQNSDSVLGTFQVWGSGGGGGGTAVGQGGGSRATGPHLSVWTLVAACG